MKKVLFFVAMAIAALTSCQHEQSQLDFADVEGKAVVQGYVYIDKGYIQDGNNYVVKSLPAEGCEVLVKVPAASGQPRRSQFPVTVLFSPENEVSPNT